ncbi:hypothetical protein ACFP3I_01570 [Chryseobacterium arachidis]|uniref:hypothetical protein n=1 Tax=Chryseobacterium arachidis TaxID=1416778 RepID=UPI0036077572
MRKKNANNSHPRGHCVYNYYLYKNNYSDSKQIIFPPKNLSFSFIFSNSSTFVPPNPSFIKR